MSFLAKIMQPKPGGTLFGNLLRSVTSKFTSGALGSGAQLTEWEIANGYRDMQGNYTPKYYAEISGAPAPHPASILAMQGVAEGVANHPPAQRAGMSIVGAWIERNFLLLLLLVAGVVWLFKGRNKTTVNLQKSKSKK